jgi:hypothetical protein
MAAETLNGDQGRHPAENGVHEKSSHAALHAIALGDRRFWDVFFYYISQ